MVRGLAIDKHNGNFLKMDRYRYVKIAYHGFQELKQSERMHLYNASKFLDYEEPRFALVDTLFSLTDAYLFAQLVDLKDTTQFLNKKTYGEIYAEARHAMDLSHRDGTIKNWVAKDPARFIMRDPLIIKTLKNLKKQGKKIFLATNSVS